MKVKIAIVVLSLSLVSGISWGWFIQGDNYGPMPVYHPQSLDKNIYQPIVSSNNNLLVLNSENGPLPKDAYIGVANIVWELIGLDREGLPEALSSEDDYVWLSWITFKIGEKDKTITNNEVSNGRNSIKGVEERIKKLKEQGTIVDSKAEGEWREALNTIVRNDLAIDNMKQRLGEKRARNVDDIIRYLNGYIMKEGKEEKIAGFEPYTKEDILKIENELRFQIFLRPKFEELLGEPIYLPYPEPAGILMGLIKGLRPLKERYGWNNTTVGMVDTLFNIWKELKGLMEEALVRRPLNLSESTGVEFGFLRGYEHDVIDRLWDIRHSPFDPRKIAIPIINPEPLLDNFFNAVKEGAYSQIQEAIDWVKTRLRAEGRLLPLLERTLGQSFFDLMNKDAGNTRFFRYYEALVLTSQGINPSGQAMSPQDLIYKVQWGGFPTAGNMGITLTARPLNFFVVDKPVNNITGKTKFNVPLGNWSFINQLILNAGFSGASNGAFEMVVRNAQGEETMFRVEELQKDSDGSRLVIPVWGPSYASWANDPAITIPDWLKDSTWKEWLDMNLWKNENGQMVLIPNRGEGKVIKVKDEIKDWRNITEIEITPLNGATLNINNGVFNLSSDKANDYLNDKNKLMPVIDAGKRVLLIAKDGAKVNKGGSPRPGDWEQGFSNLNISGKEVLIVGRSGDRIKFVIPQYCNNILELDYTTFITSIWDNSKDSHIVYK